MGGYAGEAVSLLKRCRSKGDQDPLVLEGQCFETPFLKLLPALKPAFPAIGAPRVSFPGQRRNVSGGASYAGVGKAIALVCLSRHRARRNASADAGPAPPTEMLEPKRLAVELQPPMPPLRPQEVLFGAVPGEDRGMEPPITRTDPFFWLRDDAHQNEEVQQLLEDEDAYCCRALSSLQSFSEELYKEMQSHEKESSVGIPSVQGSFAYYTRGCKQQPYGIHFRARVGQSGAPVPQDVAVPRYMNIAKRATGGGGLEASGCTGGFLVQPIGHGVSALSTWKSEVLAQAIDLQLVDEESVCGPEPSADHLFIAYGEDWEGNDSYRVSFSLGKRRSFHDTRKPEMEEAELVETDAKMNLDGSVLWEAEGHAAAWGPGERERVRRHVVGSPQSADTVVLEEKDFRDDRRFAVSICKSSDERFMIIQLLGGNAFVARSASSETAESYLLDLTARSDLVSVCPRQFGVHYEEFEALQDASVVNPKPKFQLGRRVHLDSLQSFEKFLALTGRQDGASCTATPKEAEAVKFHGEMAVSRSFVHTPRTRAAAQALFSVSLGQNDHFKTDTLRVHYTSYIVPGRDYAYHVPTREFKLIKESGPERYNPSLYRAERITSKHRQVPISLVYRADLHPQGLKGGPFPTILTGYGAYGACQDPGFDSNLLCLLDRGVVYAVAHVRGGGELGREWREEGRYLKVKNRFHDFIAADADTLLALGISQRSTLAAWGESSGGLLVAAAVNLRPELFKAMLLYVPFVDAVNTMSDPSIPLTCGEWEELGNPNQSETFYYMLEYSPYDNLRMHDYPAALVTASQNDTMVGYWEPLKYVSKLRRIKTDKNPVLLKVDFHAGHGGASNKAKSMREQAQHFAFLLDQLGV
ncbi:unnamed protein product [Effrenium voratum]|uniref:Prolyl endopeptidase n=1 Tax=Effrenium voratum TaxID=2562239 RepID=A0AA36NJY6_9DINO|nr:unnamed protein product [Effrenium voratum]